MGVSCSPFSERALSVLSQEPGLEKCFCPTPGPPVLQEVSVLVVFLLKAAGVTHSFSYL